MKYYTDTIPLPLAEKLKEKGMPMLTSVSIDIVEDKPIVDDYGAKWYRPLYAEVFDWFESQSIGIGIKHHWSGIVYQGYDWQVCQFNKSITPYFDTAYGTWHEAAEAAIEKALTLI